MSKARDLIEQFLKPVHSISVKKASDVENVFGKVLAKKILALPELKKAKKKKPSTIFLYKEKPMFSIDDGGGLFAFSVDLANQTITSDVKYYGSGNSTANYPIGQLSTGGSAPENHALVFIEMSHGYYSSFLYVVSPNITNLIGS